MSKIEVEDFYECDRCEADISDKKANSLNKKYCPCPKSSCDAKLVGKVITTTKIIRNVK